MEVLAFSRSSAFHGALGLICKLTIREIKHMENERQFYRLAQHHPSLQSTIHQITRLRVLESCETRM